MTPPSKAAKLQRLPLDQSTQLWKPYDDELTNIYLLVLDVSFNCSNILQISNKVDLSPSYNG